MAAKNQVLPSGADKRKLLSLPIAEDDALRGLLETKPSKPEKKRKPEPETAISLIHRWRKHNRG